MCAKVALMPLHSCVPCHFVVLAYMYVLCISIGQFGFYTAAALTNVNLSLTFSYVCGNMGICIIQRGFDITAL